MNKRLLKILAAIGGGLLALMILALLVGPFLIPVTPLQGLSSPQEAAESGSQFVTIPFEGTDGIDIHYLESGDTDAATTYVLLHGSNFNAFTWNETLDFFAREGRVIAYDQVPYGLTEKLLPGDWDEKNNPYSSDAAVEQLFLLLDELNVESAVLVGNSYGAVVAVQAALAQPERVEALILSDPAVYVSEEMPAWLLNSPQMRRIGPLFARMLGGSEDFVRMTYLEPDRISAERMDLNLAMTRVHNWDQAYWEYLRVWGADAPDIQSRIGEIQQPALVLCGEEDAVVPLADSQRLHEELPNADLVVIPACGHVPQEECPQQFEAAVGDWLAQ